MAVAESGTPATRNSNGSLILCLARAEAFGTRGESSTTRPDARRRGQGPPRGASSRLTKRRQEAQQSGGRPHCGKTLPKGRSFGPASASQADPRSGGVALVVDADYSTALPFRGRSLMAAAKATRSKPRLGAGLRGPVQRNNRLTRGERHEGLARERGQVRGHHPLARDSE